MLSGEGPLTLDSVNFRPRVHRTYNVPGIDLKHQMVEKG